MITGADAFYVVAGELLEAARVALTTTTAGQPDRVCVVPGAVAWDECECGLLAVSVVRTYRSDNFPTENETLQSLCSGAWRVSDLVVVVARCAPQPGENALAPTCIELDTSAQTTIIDAATVLSAVECRLEELRRDEDIVDYAVRPQTFVGPAGACVGSEIHVLVALDRW